MLRAGRLRLHSLSRQASSSSANQGPQDHYSTLGVNKTATVKEIKSAFYELSKKYHPDRNPNDKENASVKFQSIVTAYEVLANSDKRKSYDSQFMAPPRQYHSTSATRRNMDLREKKYTDLDIDFKDFEQFQRAARRRQYSSTFTYENSDEFLKRTQNYKSSLAAERERKEKRIREEVEEQQRRARYKTPTFEQLIQHERMRKSKQFNQNMQFMAVISVVLIASALVFSVRRRRK